VNGVNVAPFVEAGLNGRFPGRAGRHGRGAGGRRVVLGADTAAPGPGHGHVAGPCRP
jgi:hypothetical protein